MNNLFLTEKEVKKATQYTIGTNRMRLHSPKFSSLYPLDTFDDSSLTQFALFCVRVAGRLKLSDKEINDVGGVSALFRVIKGVHFVLSERKFIHLPLSVKLVSGECELKHRYGASSMFEFDTSGARLSRAQMHELLGYRPFFNCSERQYSVYCNVLYDVYRVVSHIPYASNAFRLEVARFLFLHISKGGVAPFHFKLHPTKPIIYHWSPTSLYEIHRIEKGQHYYLYRRFKNSFPADWTHNSAIELFF